MPSDPIETEGMPCSARPWSSVGRWKRRGFANACFSRLQVRHLSEVLAQVKDEQQYIIVRERTHRNTAESTNARVKWWNLFVIGTVVGESLFQIWWLRRFFEVKRVV